MTYQVTDPQIGTQPIADTSTTQLHPLGTILRATDPTLGGAEFIYLLGVASTTVGSIVNYNPSTFQTALAPVGTNLPEAIAVAMSANVAGQYGWYQISGVAVCAKATVAMTVGTAVGVQTIGFLNASATSKEVQGAVVAATATAAETTVQVMISRPHMQGRIT